MQRKAVFGLAVRIIAVLLIVWSMVYFVQLCGLLLSGFGQEGNPNVVQFIPMLLSAVILLLIGIAFIKNTETIAAKLYPTGTNEDINEVGVFNLAMKVIGLTFMVWAIPNVVQIIFKFCYIRYLSPVWSHVEHTAYLADNLPRVLLLLLLGWYLLKDGRVFTTMAFGHKSE